MKNIKRFLGLNILLLVFWVKPSTSLQYIPSCRAADAVQFDSYTIGVEEDGDTRIIRCHFTSDTGLSHSFNVLRMDKEQKSVKGPENSLTNGTPIEENQIRDHGHKGLCQITVSNVQDTGPKAWTLIAEQKEQNISNVIFTVNFFYKGPLLDYEIRVLEGASFMNHLDLDLNLKLCTLKYLDVEVGLNLHSADVFLTSLSLKDTELSKRVSNLGRGLCGFKFINTTVDIDNLEWTLIASDDQGKYYRGSFRTFINKNNGSRRIKREVYMGTTYTISCGEKAHTFCTLYNPSGDLVYMEGCRFKILSFGMDDLGTWKCSAGSVDTMESIDYTIELIGKDAKSVKTWVEESDDYVDIGCKLFDATTNVVYCKMIAPDQQIFNLQSFTATNRYLSIGTNLHKAICSMQIKKPLKDFENGIWRCEVGLINSDATGGVITVGKTETPTYEKRLKLTAHLDEPFTIFCEVPYSSPYCRIESPNGVKHQSKSETQTSLGRCSFSVDKANQSDNGTWICSFARQTGLPDEEIYVEVTVAEVLAYPREVTVDEKGHAHISSNSGGVPLKYCRFISPSGDAYQVENHGVSLSYVRFKASISYFGQGLEYGECGITLINPKREDHGYWTVLTQLMGSDKYGEISGKIWLQVPYSKDEARRKLHQIEAEIIDCSSFSWETYIKEMSELDILSIGPPSQYCYKQQTVLKIEELKTQK